MFFTKFWRRKVVQHDKQLSTMLDGVIEFGTGYILAKNLAVEVRVKREVMSGNGWCEPMWRDRDEVGYFRLGSEPKVDYIKIDRHNNISYWVHQSDAQCDETGKVLPVKKAK